MSHHTRVSWRITRDVLAESSSEFWDSCNIPPKVGFGVGLQDPPPNAYKFKLLDDDDVLYYEGWCTDETFEPLDWAMADSGCTSIWYYDKRTQHYEQL